jgi:nicotinamide phosphoribosyltransferase
MNNFNLLAVGTDSYKQSHHSLYPPGTEKVYSYCESRVGARFPASLFFGLQYILKKYLVGQVVTQAKIDEAAELCAAHFGREDVFNREGWEYILKKHKGYLPVVIKAVPEGEIIPTGNVLFTIENTDWQVPWLTNFLETVLMQVWSPITVATGSHEVRKIIKKYLDLTGDPAGLDFKLHDFGYRGVSSVETAALAGAAHLATGAMGTDTMAALSLLKNYYHEPMAGFSIPATEHSIMTARGPEGEADIVRQILTTHPEGLVAMVIDSFDTIGFIDQVIAKNRDIYDMIRSRNGTVVFRPDSGTLPDIDIQVFQALAEEFGTEVNSKGYHVLPPYVRMIQGDGIKWTRNSWNTSDLTEKLSDMLAERKPRHTVEQILESFRRNTISADNIAFGSGGGLLQDFDRDTQRFAIKCSWMQVNKEGREIFKKPATDSTKNSKRGRLSLVRREGQVLTVQGQDNANGNMLQTVFRNGEIIRDWTLAEIRERVSVS